MSILADFLSWLRPRAREVAPKAQITTSMELADVLRRLLSNFETSAGIEVSVETAESIDAAKACVRIISHTLAWLPLNIYRRDSGGNRVKDEQHYLHNLLYDRPNDRQTALQWKQLKQRDLEWRGNAFSFTPRGVNRRIQEFIRLHPDQVEVSEEDDRALKYVYTRADGRRIQIPADEMFHLWTWSDDGVKGISPLHQHREAFGESLALLRHSSKFFSNGARPSGVLQSPAGTTIGGAAAAALREDFERLYSGVENAWRTVVLPGGMEYTPITMSAHDADYILSRKLNRSTIAAIYGVPPHKIGDLEKATFSNIEHQAIEFVTDCMMPRLVAWEQAIKRHALDDEQSHYVKFNVNALLRGDLASRFEAYSKALGSGGGPAWMTANEVRELEELNQRPEPHADELAKATNPETGNEGKKPNASS